MSAEQVEAAHAVMDRQNDRSRVHVVHGPTGFGKTRVGIGLVHYYLSLGFNVLWVSKKWSLPLQTADEITQQFPAYERTLRRVGGDGECLSRLPTDSRGRIYFTTLQTWERRAKSDSLPRRIARSGKLLIIWDECHWAAAAKTGRKFLRYYLARRGGRANPLVVGLSATPMVGHTDLMHIAWEMAHRTGGERPERTCRRQWQL